MSNVSYLHPHYEKALPEWLRTSAACEGEAAVKALPCVLPYLNPQDESKQNKDRNADYLKRAVYFNATGRTRQGLIGLAFARDPNVQFGKFEYLAKDTNGEGYSIYHVAQKGLSGVLTHGGYGFLTDMVNDQPNIVGYDRTSITNWRVSAIGGKRKLVLLVLREMLDEPMEGDDYAAQAVVKYREFRLVDNKVVAKVWIQEGDNEPKLHETPDIVIPHAGKQLEEIPFAFVGSIDNSPNIQEAPLNGLAEMNIAHFRNSADFEDSAFFSGQVQPWISGLDEAWRDKLIDSGQYVGSRTPIAVPVGGQFGFAQAQPNTLIGEAMNKKEMHMIALGARIVEQSQVTKTATQAAGDIATNTSVLGLATANVSEGLTKAIQRLGLFDNAKLFNEGLFQITQDFTELVIDANKITALVQAWQGGAMSRIDLRSNFKRAGLIDPERTNEQIDGELETENNFAWLNPEPTTKPPTGAN